MPDIHHVDDPVLVERIGAGDAEAFEALYRYYYAPLLRFITGIVGSAVEAEGIYQDLFLDLWDRRATWQPPGTIKSYLYIVARNRAIDHLRHQQVERDWETDERQRQREPAVRPDADLGYSQLEEALHRVMQEMPERRRLMFTLSREHGLTYREIAGVLDVSVKTVETQMGRALRALREGLGPYVSRVA